MKLVKMDRFGYLKCSLLSLHILAHALPCPASHACNQVHQMLDHIDLSCMGEVQPMTKDPVCPQPRKNPIVHATTVDSLLTGKVNNCVRELKKI